MKDKYTKIKILGSGAYGSAWVVKHADYPDKNFILKEIEAQDEVEAENFINEVKVLQRISNQGCHKNILCFKEFFYTYYINVASGNPIYVLNIVTEEFTNSVTLEKFIQKNILLKEPLSRGILIKILKQLIDAVKYIHSLKIAHSDIKPDNILINNNYDIQIIDFGLSCTNWCKPFTNILYASPETLEKVLTDNNTKRRYTDIQNSDVFAIGLIAYILANNWYPFTMISSKEKAKLPPNQSIDVIITDNVKEIANYLYEYYKKHGYYIVSNYKNNTISVDNDINILIESMLLDQENRISASEADEYINNISNNLLQTYSLLLQYKI
jgi:serine/threonine protein kinase